MATATAQARAGRPDTAAAREYWETKSVRYDCLHDRLRLMLGEIAKRRPATVFDVGCATGEVARGVHELLPSADYFGCDISHAAVAKIGRPNVLQCDLNAQPVPFGGRAFECIVASGIVEYVADQPAFLRQLADRLAPGGMLLVSYINIDHFARRWRRLLGKRSRDNSTWQPLVALPQFESRLRDAGLRLQRRLVTHGRIEVNAGLAARLSPTKLLSGAAPFLAPLLAPQMIYVCQKPSV
jgi:SAM-dependent methyltransferase